MADYSVIWEADIEAESPEEAAKLAAEMMRDPESLMPVLDVKCPDGSTRYGIDTEKLD